MSLDELKEKIKQEIPITTVISHYLTIKHSGNSSLALCPFHSDTKPSMQINDSKKIFKCFACDTSGDSISFVMKYRNLNFIDAIKEISHNNRINFESYLPEKKHDPKLSLAYKVLNKACSIYHQNAKSGASRDFNEFKIERNLSDEIIDSYRIGFSNEDDVISNWILDLPNPEEQKLILDIALEIGLVKNRGHRIDEVNRICIRDTFKNRIMFPIMNPDSLVIGFTSRATKEDQTPKYINSIESFVFYKKNILYGFNFAKRAIKEKDSVIIVEGNMDQIALFANGFQNTVAVMGIALGEASLDRLICMTKNIYLAFDSDHAGLAAMVRINLQFASKGIIAKRLELTPEKDPDDFIRFHGKDAFQSQIENTEPVIDVLLRKITPDKIPGVVDRKLDLLKKSFEILAPLGLSLHATERVVNFASDVGLKSTPEQIIKTYEKYLQEQ